MQEVVTRLSLSQEQQEHSVFKNSSSCGFALGTNFWTETSNPGGALTTINSTMDLLIGGQTTASAKFAVLNMTGTGTPTASISAGTGITGGAFLTATGNLATTNKQSLLWEDQLQETYPSSLQIYNHYS